MKAKRLLFLVMAICLASGVKAQFYDGPDDIYYYLVESNNGNSVNRENADIYIFNFDGRKACQLAKESLKRVQERLRENPDYYNEKIETTEYKMEYKYSSSGTCYVRHDSWTFDGPVGPRFCNATYTYTFSNDRNSLTLKDVTESGGPAGPYNETRIYKLKKIDRSTIKVGRSRTPNGTMYE